MIAASHGTPAAFRRRAALDAIRVRRAAAPPHRALLVGLSGIDGSGKGYVAMELASLLNGMGMHCANIGVDPWLHLPNRRFDPTRPAAHFYERAIRFEEMFDRLVRPLQAKRRIRLTFDAADATSRGTYRPMTVVHDDIDVILLEGVFLFRREYRSLFDLTIWVQCSFDAALARAVKRSQEGIGTDEMIRDYQRIYFPAQRIHMARDNPALTADLVIDNEADDGPEEHPC